MSLAEFKRNIEQLEALNTKLRQAIDSEPSPTHKKVARCAEEIQQLAWRLKTTGYWSSSGDPASSGEAAGPVLHQELNFLVTGLTEAITAFVSNPIVHQPQIVDAQLLVQAGDELESIIRQVALVIKRVGELSSKDRGSKTSRKRPRVIQFTLDCDIWTSDRFADRAASIDTLQPTNIEGVTVKVKNHKLLSEESFLIGECMIPTVNDKTPETMSVTQPSLRSSSLTKSGAEPSSIKRTTKL